MSSGSYQKSPSAQLHEIALDENEHEHTNVNAEKLVSKSASLKRFFKMSHKKLDGAKSGEPLPKKDHDNEELEDTTSSEEKPKSQSALQRRFQLRGSKLSHTVDSLDTAGTSSMASNSSTSSKTTLKGSISSYWHTVFKRNRSNSGVDDTASTADISSSTSSSSTVLGSSIDNAKVSEFSSNHLEMREEIQTLSISQEP